MESLIPSLIGYLSPSKSPIAFVAFIGIISLLVSANMLGENRWHYIAIPIYIVLVLSVLLSFKVRTKFDEKEHSDQLRFTKSFGISGGLICLVYIGVNLDVTAFNREFMASYIISLIHLGLFLIYTYERTKTEETSDGINYGQLTLMTTLFLLGGSYSITYSVFDNEAIQEEIIKAGFYQASTIGLYILWGFCMLYWLFELIRTAFLRSVIVWYRKPLAMLIWYLIIPPIWLFLVFSSKQSNIVKLITIIIFLPLSLLLTLSMLNIAFDVTVQIPLIDNLVRWVIDNSTRITNDLVNVS